MDKLTGIVQAIPTLTPHPTLTSGLCLEHTVTPTATTQWPAGFGSLQQLPCMLVASGRPSCVLPQTLQPWCGLCAFCMCSDACLGMSLLHTCPLCAGPESQQLAEPLSLGCSCLMPVEQMAGLSGFPAISVPGLGYSLQVLPIGDGH